MPMLLWATFHSQKVSVYLQPLLGNRPQKAIDCGEITQTTQSSRRSRSFKVWAYWLSIGT